MKRSGKSNSHSASWRKKGDVSQYARDIGLDPTSQMRMDLCGEDIVRAGPPTESHFTAYSHRELAPPSNVRPWMHSPNIPER